MTRRVAATAAVLCLTVACGHPNAAAEAAIDPEVYRGVLGIPPPLQVPSIPTSNPPTAAKRELGRHLFYDVRLSANQTQACASCHKQQLAFTDGLTRPTGSTGQLLHRNAQGLANAAYATTLTWANSNLLSLEAQIPIPLRNDSPIELGVLDGAVPEVEARLAADPIYAALFAAAFPGATTAGPTVQKAVLALATFCRAIVSADSPYDRYRAGDPNALSAAQRRGLALFNGERLECFHCHSGTNLTTSYHDAKTAPGSETYPFFNNGLYNVDGKGSYPAEDQGLYDVTLQPQQRGFFRPQSLRNVALTAPYMHDGSIATLRDVIAHYAAGGRLIADGPNAGDGRVSPLKSGLVRGFAISDDETADLLAFFDALTDTSLLTNPALAAP